MRPALIVSRSFDAPTSALYYAMMITSAANRGWPDDISLEADHADFGLPRPSLIRVAKIASIAATDASLLGRLRGMKLEAVAEIVRKATRITPPA